MNRYFFRRAWLPALLAMMGMLLTWLAVTAGQDAARRREMAGYKLRATQAQLDLQRAKAENAPAPDVERLAAVAAAKEKDFADALPERYGPTKFGRQFSGWDGRRYEEIAEQGYVFHQPNASAAEKEDSSMVVGESERRTKNVVWYPLYPMLGRLVYKALSIDAIYALTAVSWVCCLLAAVALFHYARERAARQNDLESPLDSPARMTVVLLLFGPCALFLYANFTESLFTLLMVLFLSCLQARWWWRAAMIAAIAAASRSQGVLFGPVLALTFMWRARSYVPHKRLMIAAALGVISATGLIGYMVFLQQRFGDPLAFMHAQVYWNVGLNGERFEYALMPTNALGRIWKMSTTLPLDLPRLWESLCVVWPPVVLLVGRKRLSFELSLMGWMLWALPFVSNCMAGSPPMDSQWMSMGRFMAVLVPGQLVIADWLVRRPKWMPFVVVPSAGLFVLFAYLYGTGAWVG